MLKLYIKIADGFYDAQISSGVKFTKGRLKFRKDVKEALTYFIDLAEKVERAKLELPPKRDERSCNCKVEGCGCKVYDFNEALDLCYFILAKVLGELKMEEDLHNEKINELTEAFQRIEELEKWKEAGQQHIRMLIEDKESLQATLSETEQAQGWFAEMYNQRFHQVQKLRADLKELREITIMELSQADLVEKHFPKGECKERGVALVLHAEMLIAIHKFYNKHLTGEGK